MWQLKKDTCADTYMRLDPSDNLIDTDLVLINLPAIDTMPINRVSSTSTRTNLSLRIFEPKLHSSCINIASTKMSIDLQAF